MHLHFPDELLNYEVHLPDLVLKGKSVFEALERYSKIINESKNKSIMSKKIIKEAITPEQKEALMNDAVSVAQAILKLYKSVTTSINNPSLTALVDSLKTQSDSLMNAIKDAGGDSSSSSEEDERMDLERPESRKEVIESIEINKKNTRVSLKEHQWKASIDLKPEFKAFINSDKKLTECKKIVKKLKTYIESVNKTLGQDELNLFENITHDFESAKSLKEFNNTLTGLYDWADSNNVQIILK